MFTPEGYSLEPVDMTWWSLTCNMDSSVVYLREYVGIRRERRLGMGDPGAGADPSNVVHMSRGPRRPKRG